MSDTIVKGSCFCNAVNYQIHGNMGIFQYCHCSRCRKFTGSAHAANLFVAPAQFKWLKGESSVATFNPPDTRYFATAFCNKCGSSLPWLSKSGKVMVVPAGSLDGDPGISPTQNIFCGSRPAWYMAASSLPEHASMPPRKG